MGVRLNDTAVLLEPDTTPDAGTSRPRIDWSKDPASATPSKFQAQPSVDGGSSAEEQTVMAQWRGFLPPQWDGIVTPAFRIRWHDEDYSIDGPISVHRRGGRVRFLTLSMRLAK